MMHGIFPDHQQNSPNFPTSSISDLPGQWEPILDENI